MYTLNYPHNQEYSTTIAFKTQIIKKISGEQRISKNLYPTRSFSFKFELAPQDSIQFFEDYKKIRQSPFLYSWCGFAPYYGKDSKNIDYLLRIEPSKIGIKSLQFGYSQVSLQTFTIDDGNIIKCRFPREQSPYQLEGAVEFDNGAKYQGEGKISQKILTPGKFYKLKIKSTQTLGPSPVLSTQTSSAEELERYIMTGDAEISFIAASETFCIEFEENSAGTITEIAVLQLSKPEIPSESGLYIMDFDYNIDHTIELETLSESDEIITPLYSVREYNPDVRRRFLLTLELSTVESMRFEQFFKAQMGRYKAFFWDYQGKRLKVRFDSDKAEFKVFPLGYSEVKIPLIEV